MRRRNQSSYRSGDFYRIDDLTGFKVRASETVKLWNGMITHQSNYEERNPQDFVRATHDRQRVPDPRPENTGSRLNIDMVGLTIDNTDVDIDQQGDRFLDTNEVTRDDL